MRIRSTLLLSALLLGSLVLGTAAAQPNLAPPSGPVDPYSAPRAQHQRGKLAPAMKAGLIERFDRDGDGRLTGRERVRAKRFVKKMRHHARQQRQQQQHRQQR